MLLSHPIRMPMSTGAGAVSLGLGLAIFGFLSGAPIFFASRLPDWTALPVGILAGCWGLGMLLLPFAMWKERASDVELGPEGLRILGGPHDGTQLSWRDLAEGSVEAGQSMPEGTLDATKRLLLPHGVQLSTNEPEELESWKALAATIRTLAAESVGPRRGPMATVTRSDVVRCAGCGGLAVPSSNARVRCGWCDAEISMPDDVRTEVQALAKLMSARARSVNSLRTLLRWPQRGWVNVVLLLALPFMAIAWPASAVLFDEFLQSRHVFDWSHGVALFVFAACASAGLFLLARSQVAVRRAVALISARFGALPPEKEGASYQCRMCGAPLLRDPESPLTRCVYCQADNVIARGLAVWALPEIEQAQGLDALLRQSTNERHRWRRSAVGSLVLLVVAGATLVQPLAEVWHQVDAPRTAPEESTTEVVAR